MDNLYKIIEQIQKDLHCPVCGKKFEVGEMKIRGIFNHTIIIQTVCDESHATLFMTKLQKNMQKSRPITSKEILTLRNKLKDFGGDFEEILSK